MTPSSSWSFIMSIKPAYTRMEPSAVALAFTSFAQVHLEVEMQAVFIDVLARQALEALGVFVVGGASFRVRSP